MFQTTTEAALLRLLQVLSARGYDFVTPLNTTTALIRRRRQADPARDLRDVLGWSLPFESGAIDPEIEALLLEAGVLKGGPAGYSATVRVARVAGALFLHSAFGANDPDPVFLGPDSYRFAEFLRVELSGGAAVRSIVDIGAGAGVGGIVAGRLTGAPDVRLGDVNDKALRFARINARHAGLTVRTEISDGMTGIDGAPDLVVSNPPFIADSGRLHSDGGEQHGGALSLVWAEQAMRRLAPGGRLLLYTGSAIVAGRDVLRAELQRLADRFDGELAYRELDPDIFGSELTRPAYSQVERIAAVGAVVRKA